MPETTTAQANHYPEVPVLNATGWNSIIIATNTLPD